MNSILRDVLIEKYIQIHFSQFVTIVQDAVPEIAKMKNSQFQGLVNLVKNPAYENADALIKKLDDNTGRLWHDQYPNLYPTLLKGFGRLKNLGEKIIEEINQSSEMDIKPEDLDINEIHMELIRAYVSSAVKLHLGS